MNDLVKSRYKDSFEELQLIETGGFGRVFQVKDRLNGKFYALKKIDFEKEGEKEMKYIMREISIWPKLNEEFVVKFYNSWIELNTVYIQLELCDDSLKNILSVKQKAFNRYPDQEFDIFEYYISCEMFVEILQCVQYLHQLEPPIIHRDLKPDNILITYNNTNGRFFKICDFGLAVVHEKTSMSHSSNVGTVSFCAPEVKFGRKYNCKADVYSVGYTAKELFNISQDNKDSNHETLKTLINSMIVPRFVKRPDISQVLDAAMECRVNKEVVKQSQGFESTINRLKVFDNNFFHKFIVFKLEM